MRYDRTLRISEEIKKVVSQVIRSEIKDPRISPLTSITRVETTNDLRFVNIHISVLGDEESADATLQGLKSAKGFIRSAIGKAVSLRYTPEPIFKLDQSIEISVRMSKLIDDVSKTGKADDEDEQDPNHSEE